MCETAYQIRVYTIPVRVTALYIYGSIHVYMYSTVTVLASAQGALSWQACKSGGGAFTRTGADFYILANAPPLLPNIPCHIDSTCIWYTKYTN